MDSYIKLNLTKGNIDLLIIAYNKKVLTKEMGRMIYSSKSYLNNAFDRLVMMRYLTKVNEKEEYVITETGVIYLKDNYIIEDDRRITVNCPHCDTTNHCLKDDYLTNFQWCTECFKSINFQIIKGEKNG